MSSSSDLTTKIYTLHDPRTGEVRYVWKTVKPLTTRLSQHVRPRSFDTHHARWIRTLVSVGLKPEIRLLQTIVGPEWANAERYWIQYFRERGCHLTNGTNGGEGAPGRVHSQTTRDKIAMSAQARDISYLHSLERHPEWRAKMRQANLGSRNGTAKLDELKVTQIKRHLLAGTQTHTNLAAEYGVSRRTISMIATGGRWSHVAPADVDNEFLF